VPGKFLCTSPPYFLHKHKRSRFYMLLIRKQWLDRARKLGLISAKCVSDSTKNCMVSARRGGKVIGVAARLRDTAGSSLCVTVCYDVIYVPRRRRILFQPGGSLISAL
jgi:hypothetical protein